MASQGKRLTEEALIQLLTYIKNVTGMIIDPSTLIADNETDGEDKTYSITKILTLLSGKIDRITLTQAINDVKVLIPTKLTDLEDDFTYLTDEEIDEIWDKVLKEAK